MELQELLTAGADTSWWEVLLRLVIAAAFAAAIGWERESKGRDAGLRTHIMVGLGAAGFAVIALDVQSLVPDGGEASVSVDPVRIIAALVGGVGFLGAGAIMQSNGGVRGLTTAAGLWVTASIGAASGLGFYLTAGAISAIALATLGGVHLLERVAGGRSTD